MFASRLHVCVMYTPYILLLYCKTGVCRGKHIFRKNIDCEYSLVPPRPSGSNVYPQSILSQNIKNINFFRDEIFNFNS